MEELEETWKERLRLLKENLTCYSGMVDSVLKEERRPDKIKSKFEQKQAKEERTMSELLDSRRQSLTKKSSEQARQQLVLAKCKRSGNKTKLEVEKTRQVQCTH